MGLDKTAINMLAGALGILFIGLVVDGLNAFLPDLDPLLKILFGLVGGTILVGLKIVKKF